MFVASGSCKTLVSRIEINTHGDHPNVTWFITAVMLFSVYHSVGVSSKNGGCSGFIGFLFRVRGLKQIPACGKNRDNV